MNKRDEVRLLAEAERMMDSGEMSFVIFKGERCSVPSGCMAEFELVQGQTINEAIFLEILRWNIADIEREIGERKVH